MFVHSDCRNVAAHGPFDLVFGDPPFGIGEDYIQFKDNMTDAQYEEFTLDWVWAAWCALNDTGVLLLHGPDKCAELYLYAARLFGIHTRRIMWVQWQYNFGVCLSPACGKFIDTRCHCLAFAKGASYPWNPPMVESLRATKYKDKRVTETKGGTRLPGTVWGVESDGTGWGRVTGNSAERWNPRIHPNQLPERYIRRLFKTFTNPGHRVGIMFAGSGTEAVQAADLGLPFVAFDVSLPSLISASERLRLRGAIVRD